jgi:hypothetical protein
LALGKLTVLGLAFLLSACTQGHCRRKTDVPGEAKPVEAPAAAVAETKTSDKDRVLVYKYDGSMQCGMGKPLALDVMAKELQGIPVLSSVKKRDGLMHIQVCGSITGMANVYEIPAKFQKQAEGKGFKKWSFE